MPQLLSTFVPLYLHEQAYTCTGKHDVAWPRVARHAGWRIVEWDRTASGGADAMSRANRVIEAERKCLVCDWVGSVQEPDDTPEIGVPCATCRAPTERIAVRRSWMRPPNIH